MNPRKTLPYLACVGAAFLSLTASSAPGQTPVTPAAAPGAAAAPEKPPLKQEELDQLLAPIALYPDSLLSQMFMASTFPLEVVQADRWVKAQKDLKGDALAKELERQPWDPSVKSMVNVPSVLSTMSESLDVTVKLGDAFIDQQADVLRTVQTLRTNAKAEGNLKSADEQKVGVEPAPAGIVPAEVITIEPVKTEVIYVPVYSPTVVYGVWPYPTYPPYPYYPPYPPGYVASPVIGFGVGLVCGVARGESPSPLGPLVGQAVEQGYKQAAQPFHGCVYRILTSQGKHANGGTLSGIANDVMTGGFAVIAVPAQSGNSGVMTFIVNHQGVVYQKDLGEETEERARAMSSFDPGEGWSKVE